MCICVQLMKALPTLLRMRSPHVFWIDHSNDMDSGTFYRGGSSVTSSFSAHLTPQPVPHRPFEGTAGYVQSPAPTDAWGIVGQKLDQLMVHAQQQSEDITILKEEVASLRAEVAIMKEGQQTADVTSRRQKLPTDLSVRYLTVLLNRGCYLPG